MGRIVDSWCSISMDNLVSKLVPSLYYFKLIWDSQATELTACYLALVHRVMLLTVLFLLFPELFGFLNSQNDFKGKVSFYMSKVIRGLSAHLPSDHTPGQEHPQNFLVGQLWTEIHQLRLPSPLLLTVLFSQY